MRVYVPLTLPGLAKAHETGVLAADPFAAYAVTPALREWCGTEDLEELEYAALGEAANASLRLLAADPEAAPRRIVVAVDVPDRAVAPDPEGLGEVTVAASAPLAKAAAVHADADDAEADVTVAARAVEAAEDGDDAARAAVDGAEDHELLWFATQEIPGLLAPR
ncbi:MULTISPECIES: DUF6912 family protein [unclassified Streptomyces]|uniref:DUF6912 family protein n=1 Tax=unclassified Streptomyces TaxID=2593676 RepID=UPI002E814A43|nr:hypothetical protein [Streptomyces sp. NBC_00566]WUB88479.1 hypothetical protein OG812_18625 [Streptomyces sp. NBC_00566]